MRWSTQLLFGAALLMGAPAAQAEESTTASTVNPAPSAPSSLVLHFDPGSAAIRPKDVSLLDEASRLYRAGKPIVMTVTGGVPTPQARQPLTCGCPSSGRTTSFRASFRAEFRSTDFR